MMRSTAEKMKGEAAKEDRERKQEIQLAKIAAGTITLFIISWITYGIVSQIAILGSVPTLHSLRVCIICDRNQEVLI